LLLEISLLDLNKFILKPILMKTKSAIYTVLFIGLLLPLLLSCEKEITPNSGKTVTDNDGNLYSTVTIGTQVWMNENLKTKAYRDGAVIPEVTVVTAWSDLGTPAYCWYNNDPANTNIYGALYNWYAVNTGKLCPTGWHVPSNAEWTTLIDFLGGVDVAGGKLKETGTSHWISPNTDATNEISFRALPGGYRNYDGIFSAVGYTGRWWTKTEDSLNYPFSMGLMYFTKSTISSSMNSKKNGFSVRCLKD
jgi:uncharacterized protein (TIGR02145 family)